MREEDGEAKAKALAIVNQLVCRMHCHKVNLNLPADRMQCLESSLIYCHDGGGDALTRARLWANSATEGPNRLRCGALGALRG